MYPNPGVIKIKRQYTRVFWAVALKKPIPNITIFCHGGECITANEIGEGFLGFSSSKKTFDKACKILIYLHFLTIEINI